MSIDTIFIESRTLEFRILLPYLDLTLEEQNENSYVCINGACPA
jgi:hypothetical protein